MQVRSAGSLALIRLGSTLLIKTNPQSLNLQSYVRKNRLVNTDQAGLRCIWDDGSFDSEDDKDSGSKAQWLQVLIIFRELVMDQVVKSEESAQLVGSVEEVPDQ